MRRLCTWESWITCTPLNFCGTTYWVSDLIPWGFLLRRSGAHGAAAYRCGSSGHLWTLGPWDQAWEKQDWTGHLRSFRNCCWTSVGLWAPNPLPKQTTVVRPWGAMMEYGFAYTVCRRAVFYYGNGPVWHQVGGHHGERSGWSNFEPRVCRLHVGWLMGDIDIAL